MNMDLTENDIMLAIGAMLLLTQLTIALLSLRLDRLDRRVDNILEEQGYEDSYEEEYDYEGDYDDVDYEYNEIEDGDEGNEERGEEDDYALAIARAIEEGREGDLDRQCLPPLSPSVSVSGCVSKRRGKLCSNVRNHTKRK